MKVENYSKENLLIEIKNKVNNLDSRERIVLMLPYKCKIHRIEIYMSESLTNVSSYYSAFFGESFTHKVTISQFNDNSNKAAKVVSFTYKNEFFEMIDFMLEQIYNLK